MTLAASIVPRAALWSAWNAEPGAIAAAFVACVWYGAGLYATGVRAVSRARAVAFLAGICSALLAVLSPLNAAAIATLSSHMVQHMWLMFVSAPLIVAGRPGLVMGLALPWRLGRAAFGAAHRPPVSGTLRLLRNPLVIMVVYTAVIWTWHLPGPYQAALRDRGIHSLEHLSFMGIALAFWAGVTRTGPRRRIEYVPSMALVLGTMLESTWLAAILTFGGLAYPAYARAAAVWHVDALSDQQVAGAIMWIPPAIVFLVTFSVLFIRWFHDLEAQHPDVTAVRP